jgi:hypothetical protein
MTEEERKKYMEEIQDVLLDLQLEGKIKIEEISSQAEGDRETTTIRIQPILNTQEEVEEFYRRAKMCGYITQKEETEQENSDSDEPEE